METAANRRLQDIISSTLIPLPSVVLLAGTPPLETLNVPFARPEASVLIQTAVRYLHAPLVSILCPDLRVALHAQLGEYARAPRFLCRKSAMQAIMRQIIK